MILDSHCHAWSTWPYQDATQWPYRLPVPDPDSRGRVEQLLYEMEQHGVEQAVLVCAQITGNLANNVYVAEQVKRYPERLIQFADVDSFWSASYHTPRAAQRLERMSERWPIRGVTHYLQDDDDGSWLYSDEGLAFFQQAAVHGLIADIKCRPHQQPAIRRVAERFPALPILCHHLGLLQARDKPPHPQLKEVVAAAKLPNIYFKVSGFAYCAHVAWDYPYSDTHWIVRALYENLGPHRLCWASDYPVVRYFMTYQQALEVVRAHCSFIPEADQHWILGKTLARLLEKGTG